MSSRSATRAATRGGEADARSRSLLAALERIGAGAERRDAHPAFPGDAFDDLAATGALAVGVPGADGALATFAEGWALVRAVSAADGAVGRILDGHLNAVERLRVQASPALRDQELAAVAAGARRLGVWGADPVPGEGAPARLVGGPDDLRVVGVKVFCSGAGGLDHALVSVRDADARVRLAYLDVREGVEVDRAWYRAAGMRASESHRVVFHGTPVRGLLGGPGALVAEPWFGRDAIRTAACWAGLADAALAATRDELAARGEPSELVARAAGAMLSAQGTIDRWLEGAAARADADPGASLGDLSVMLRAALTGACHAILDEAARACGSRPFATGRRLDRVRRDLDLFLMQHRLDPLLARLGARALAERRAP